MKITSTSRRLRWIALAICIALFGSTAATHAAVLAYDDLEDAVLGSLSGQTSGTGFTGGYVLTSGAVGVVSNTSLSYSNGPISIAGGTNAIYVAYPDKTVFTRAIGTQNGDSLYLSFLFRTPTADGTSGDFLSFGFNSSADQTTAGLVHRLNDASTDHDFGLRAGEANIMPPPEGTEANRTYFLVLRLRKLTPGTANAYNELAIFVDPSSVYEPVPSLVITNTRAAAMTHIAARVALSEAGDGYFLDNLCIGASYDDVVFPNGSPVVVAPSISPNGGSAAVSQLVTLVTETPGASIRYTLDGSTPSATVGTLYTAPFTLTSSAVVKAIACKDGMYDSPLSTAQFVVYKQWTGLGIDNLWSTADNWNFSGSPAGGDLVFEMADLISSETVNNIVSSSLAVSSLSYTNSGDTSYHVTQIDPGVTLTVDGSTTPVNALFVGRGSVTATGEPRTRVSMTGGGELVVNAPGSDILITRRSSSDRGYAYLKLSGLSRFEANVKDFSIGRYDRAVGYVTLAATNAIVAEKFCVGDSGGGANGDTSELILGTVNTLHADQIALGAPALNTYNENRCSVYFAAGLENPTLTIRGTVGGTSRAALSMGGHGDRSISWDSERTVFGTLNTLGANLDARLSTLVLSQGQGKTTGKGGATGTLSMDAGLVDAEAVVLGSSLKGKSSANVAKGVLNIAGGKFIAGSMTCANNISESQNVAGEINLSQSGEVEINGPVVLGNKGGTAPSVVTSFALDGGTMVVRDDMAPGANPTNVVVAVSLNGAAFIVTNAAETATLRIENGTLALVSGTAEFDRLVTTNALCTTQVTLAGTGAGDYATVAVNDSVKLGGTLDVAFAGGYAPSGGELWKIVEGTGVRTGTFAVENLPENFKVVYTTDGYWIANPALGTTIIIR